MALRNGVTSISSIVTPFSFICFSKSASDAWVARDALSPAFRASSLRIVCCSGGSLSNQAALVTMPVIRLMWPVLVTRLVTS